MGASIHLGFSKKKNVLGWTVIPRWKRSLRSFQVSYMHPCHSCSMASFKSLSRGRIANQPIILSQRVGALFNPLAPRKFSKFQQRDTHCKNKWSLDYWCDPQSQQVPSTSAPQEISLSKVGFLFNMNNQVFVECLGTIVEFHIFWAHVQSCLEDLIYSNSPLK